MPRRIYSTIIILLSLATVGGATFIAIQKAKAPAQKTGTAKAASKQKPAASSSSANTAVGPIRQADPNRAPQASVDEALFTNEEFFGGQASVARPYAVAIERVTTLLAQYPKDARLHRSLTMPARQRHAADAKVAPE